MRVSDDITCDLMGWGLGRIFDDTSVGALFGSGPGRALGAYRRLLASGSNPAAYLEFPLLGPTSHDVFVGPYGDGARPGSHLGAECPHACRAVWDWHCASRREEAHDVLFELDAEAPADPCAGIHYRHFGDLALAGGFLRAMGEGWRFPHYADVVGRLPEGWLAAYCAVFFGRPGAPTRLEVYPDAPERRRIATDPAYLGACLEAAGFGALDGRMLGQACEIAALGRPIALQLDILADGSLGRTLSVVSFLERTGFDGGELCRDGGAIARVCGLLQRMASQTDAGGRSDAS